MIVVTVMYPENEDATFDMDYYLNDHLKMVGDRWGGMGLKGARVLKGVAGGEPGSAAPYRVMAVVDFESLEAFQAAAAAHGEEIFGDIPNFTNITPVVQISDIAAG
ncbi:MAG: hypothetical protein ACI9TH_004117 [Kiritimatiellia bacterium]|jgi:uncharacterized protein (TIGR02118 family)